MSFFDGLCGFNQTFFLGAELPYPWEFHDAFEEGKGFLPDDWIDDEDPVSVVRQYLAQ